VSGAGNQQERLSRQEQRRWWLAGFVEGEGSVCVSLKRHPAAAFGYFVQPEFFLYQHRKRRSLLEMAAEEFGSGTIFPKPGNPDVLVLKLSDRRVLTSTVVPFLRTYMRFSARVEDYEIFATVVELLNEGAHRTVEGLVGLVRLAYTINGNGKHRRIPQDEVLGRILRGHTLNAPSQGEDMVRPPRRRGELDGTETI
jgi:LAGLIDADG DNA endonuclease family protein